MKLYCALLLLSLTHVDTAISSIINRQSNNQEFYKQFQEVFEKIEREYVQQPNKQKMLEEALVGMVSSLDPHSTYLTGGELEEFVNGIKGEFGGIGIEVACEAKAESIKIVTPIKGLPADRAGIKAGDQVISVDNELVTTLGCTKAIKKMRGEKATQVKLLIISGEENTPKEYELTREIIKIPSVKVGMEQQIAYISLAAFNDSTLTELKSGLATLIDDATHPLRGIILDLRNNPGGKLDQAIAVSEYFINEGVIVSIKGRDLNSGVKYFANPKSPKAPNVPVVVLINGASASAAEIMAAALQYHKRGVILGTQSFGKGSVQTLVELNSTSAIKLTTSQYYTPSGKSIQAEGVKPDIIVAQAKVEYPKESNGEKYSEASLKNSLPNPDLTSQVTTDKITGVDEKKGVDNTLIQNRYQNDHQYARALDLIKALDILRIASKE